MKPDPEQLAPGRFPLIAYSLPSAPTSMLMMMLVVYLAPFYAAEMGLELAAVGGIFFLARLWDAVIGVRLRLVATAAPHTTVKSRSVEARDVVIDA